MTLSKRNPDGPGSWVGSQGRTPDIESKKLTDDYYAERAKKAEARRVKRLEQEANQKKILADIEAMRGTPPPGGSHD